MDILQRSSQIIEIDLERLAATIFYRTGTKIMSVPGVYVGELRCIVFGKLLHLARSGPRTLIAVIAIGLKTVKTLIDVRNEARLAHLTVVDDIDAKIDLFPHDIR